VGQKIYIHVSMRLKRNNLHDNTLEELQHKDTLIVIGNPYIS
jgi:hypothetical protein